MIKNSKFFLKLTQRSASNCFSYKHNRLISFTSRYNQDKSKTDNNVKSRGIIERQIGFLLKKWKKVFADNNISEPESSIQNILAHVSGVKKFEHLSRFSEKVLDDETIGKLDKLCQKRLQRVPIQYVIREWDFRDLTLKMNPPVFIPRPETELLVDIVLKEIEEKKGKQIPREKILELCCGSGAISLALLKSNIELRMVAVDFLPEACKLTKENAELIGVSNRLEVLLKEISMNFRLNETFDLIVSNPPYVPTKDVEKVQPEIKMYEDLRALDGGEDGTEIIKLILNLAAGELLHRGGKIFLEVDPTHPTILEHFLSRERQLRLKLTRVFKDFNKIDRFVEISKL